MTVGYCQNRKAKQNIKPSRATTINYLNEKISQYAVPYIYLINTRSTIQLSNGSKRFNQTSNGINTSEYHISFNNDNSRVNLLATMVERYIETSSNIDESITYQIEAPFEKLSKINILQPEFNKDPDVILNDGSKQSQTSQSDNTLLQLLFSGNCVKYIKNSTVEYRNYYNIAFSTGEDNLLEKVKRAFINLKTYYPIQKSNDPFEND
ncbi:hypothetical protein GCM10027592_03320 [Spirosoma flavus]